MPTLNIGKVRYTWKGTYSATTAYSILDRVKDADGYVYEAIKAAPAGTALTNETYWIKLSVQGPRGQKGDTGNDGPKGDTGSAPTAILYTAQTGLTDAQKTQARTNINAASASDVVKLSTQTGLTDTQKSAARGNIGAVAKTEAVLLDEQTISDTDKEQIYENLGLIQMFKELCLANGATQAEIDALS